MEQFRVLVFLAIIIVLSISTEQAYATNPNHALKITFANDPAKSFSIPLANNETQKIFQNKIWNQDNSSRFNLISYAIDGEPIIPISRDNGTIELQVSTNSDHQIVFYSAIQHPIYITGTNLFKFFPPSPTHDNWFDRNSIISIAVPYVIESNQEKVRQQLIGWSTDNAYTNVILRKETGFYTLSNINMNDVRKIDFEYKNQYFINVLSNFGHPVGSGWYDDGSIITISVIPGNDFILKRNFVGWEGSIIGQGTQESANVLVSSPQTIIAMWQEDYTVISIIGISAVSGITYVIIRHKRKSLPKKHSTYGIT